MITVVLILVLLGLLIVYIVIKEGRPSNYPPGPGWWPIIGNGFLLRKLSKKLKGQHLALSKIAKDYNTPILGLKLGRDLVVVALSLEANRAVLTRDVFTGRPISFFMKLRCFGKIQAYPPSKEGRRRVMWGSTLTQDVTALPSLVREETCSPHRYGLLPRTPWMQPCGCALVFTSVKGPVLVASYNRQRHLGFILSFEPTGERQDLRITSTDGYVWKEKRSFTVRHLKQFGYGKEVMEDLITDEVKELIQFLQNEKEVESIGDLTAPSVLNVLWVLATGNRLEKGDPKLKKLLKLLTSRARAFDMAGGILNQMPWLRYIAPKGTGYSLLQELNTEIKNFLMEAVDEQKKTFKPSRIRNLIDAFLQERSSEHKFSSFSDDELVVLLLDLFLGGAQTTSQTLDFAFLLMIKYPEVQEKVHRNIIESIGRSRLPSVEDKPNLVYTEAVLLEVMRTYCVTPIIGPRRTLEDTTLNGYYIPKNTTILLNLYTVHHDEAVFPDPYHFRPERFISSDGLSLINHENVLTFGLGKRRCLGEALAKSCLFLIFAGIMQNFEITKVSDKEPSLQPLLGLTLAPKPYSLRFQYL